MFLSDQIISHEEAFKHRHFATVVQSKIIDQKLYVTIKNTSASTIQKVAILCSIKDVKIKGGYGEINRRILPGQEVTEVFNEIRRYPQRLWAFNEENINMNDALSAECASESVYKKDASSVFFTYLT